MDRNGETESIDVSLWMALVKLTATVGLKNPVSHEASGSTSNIWVYGTLF